MKQFPDIRNVPDGLEEGLHGILSEIKQCLEVMLSRRNDYLPSESWDIVNKSYIELPIPIQETDAKLYAGSGTPESNVVANPGSIYLRTDGGASTTFYVKETGTDNTGWVAK